MKQPRIKGLGILLGFALLACLVLSYDAYTKWALKGAFKQNFQAHVTEISKDALQRNAQTAEVSEVSISDISMRRVLSKKQAQLDAAEVLGGLSIPSVGINLPILPGADSSQLYKGATMLESSDELFNLNVILGAHSVYDGKELLFTPLMQIQEGADIYVTDKREIAHYVVTERLQVRAGREDLLHAEDFGRLTLITGEQEGQIVIRAKMLTKEKYTQENVGTLYSLFGVD